MGKKVFVNIPFYSSGTIKGVCTSIGRLTDVKSYYTNRKTALEAGGFGRQRILVSPDAYESTEYLTKSINNMFIDCVDLIQKANSFTYPKATIKVANLSAWKLCKLFQDTLANGDYFNNFKLSFFITASYKDYLEMDKNTYTDTSIFTTYIDVLTNTTNSFNIPSSNLAFAGKKNINSNQDFLYLTNIYIDRTQEIGLDIGNANVSTSDLLAYMDNITTYLSLGELEITRRQTEHGIEEWLSLPLTNSDAIQTSKRSFYLPIYPPELIEGRVLYMTNFTLTIPAQYSFLNPNRVYDLPGDAGTDEPTFFSNHHLLPQFQDTHTSEPITFTVNKLASGLKFTSNLVNISPSNCSANSSDKGYIHSYNEETHLEANYHGVPYVNNAHASVYQIVQDLLLDYTIFRLHFYGSDINKYVNITLRDFITKGLDWESLQYGNTDVVCNYTLFLPSLDYISDNSSTTTRLLKHHLAAFLNVHSIVDFKFDLSLMDKNKGIYLGTDKPQRVFIGTNEVKYFVADTEETVSYTIPARSYYCRSGYTTDSLTSQLSACTLCNGTGTVTKQTTCPTCKGSKWVSSTFPCPTCDGSGYSYYGPYCGKCNGKGYQWSCNACGTSAEGLDGYIASVCGKCGASLTASNALVEVMCAHCNGNGRIWGQCQECYGSGEATGSKKCSNCSGSGYINSKSTCSNCNGVAGAGGLPFTKTNSSSIKVTSDTKTSEETYKKFLTIMHP